MTKPHLLTATAAAPEKGVNNHGATMGLDEILDVLWVLDQAGALSTDRVVKAASQSPQLLAAARTSAIRLRDEAERSCEHDWRTRDAISEGWDRVTNSLTDAMVVAVDQQIVLPPQANARVSSVLIVETATGMATAERSFVRTPLAGEEIEVAENLCVKVESVTWIDAEARLRGRDSEANVDAYVRAGFTVIPPRPRRAAQSAPTRSAPRKTAVRKTSQSRQTRKRPA